MQKSITASERNHALPHMEQKKLDRINELARKKKSGATLTEQERSGIGMQGYHHSPLPRRAVAVAAVDPGACDELFCLRRGPDRFE